MAQPQHSLPNCSPSIMIAVVTSPSLYGEFRALMALVMPSTLSTYCFFAMSLTLLSIMGHLGIDQLAAVSYSQMAMDLTTLIFTQGFNAGMNALCSQAFGANNFNLLSQYGLLTATMVTVMCIPTAVLWWNLGDLLLVVGVKEQVAEYARVYCRLWILGMWPRSMFQVLSIFYQAQQIVLPTTIINLATVILNFALATGLTYGKFGLPALGFIGCPLGTAVAMWLRLAVYFYFMHMYKKYDRKCRWSWTRQSFNFKSLGMLVSMGFPLALGNLFEDSQLQTMALFAAKIGEVQLGTHNAMMELFLFATSPIFGLSDGAVTRIGKHLGGGKTQLARSVSTIAATGIGVVALANATTIFAFRWYLGRIFSDDSNVLANFNQIAPTAAAAYVFLSFFAYALMILEAQARPLPIMVAFIVGSWGVGVPSAYFLGLGQSRQWFLGIWLGMIGGYVVTASIAFYYAYWKTDWDVAAQEAVARSQSKDDELEDSPLLTKGSII